MADFMPMEMANDALPVHLGPFGKHVHHLASMVNVNDVRFTRQVLQQD